MFYIAVHVEYYLIGIKQKYLTHCLLILMYNDIILITVLHHNLLSFQYNVFLTCFLWRNTSFLLTGSKMLLPIKKISLWRKWVLFSRICAQYCIIQKVTFTHVKITVVKFALHEEHDPWSATRLQQFISYRSPLRYRLLNIFLIPH